MKANTPRWVSRLAYACSITVFCAALAACGGGGGSTSPGGGAPTSAGSAASAQGYPVTIQNCGHTLTFDKPPSRVVLGYHPFAEDFVGLGLASRAIGRVGYQGGLEEAPILPEQAADFKRIPVVSDNNYPPPREQMLSLRPDFLLAYADFDYGGKSQAVDGLATYDELAAAGIKAYTVICPDAGGSYSNENLEGGYRTLLDLGKIFGASDRAERRVAAMQAQIAAVAQKVRGQPVAKVLGYFAGGGKGPLDLVGGGNALVKEILEAAGGENTFAPVPEYDLQASLEAIAGKQVDAYLIFADSKDATDTLDGSNEAQFLFDTFPNLQASKDRRFVVTDYGFVAAGWRVAQTVEDIARQLHPNAFK